MSSTIYPCLWFNGEAKTAANFYCSVFKDSKITADTPMVVNFELSGQKFMGLNGGPQFIMNPSISFFVVLETESETDEAWRKLSAGGKVLMPLDKYDWSEKYGWVQDRFGLSWQLSFGKLEDVGQVFTPMLMFTGKQQGRTKEAIEYYKTFFDNSAVIGIMEYDARENEKPGFVKHAQFKLNGYIMMAMDSSGPHAFSFNEAISLVVECRDQKEIDHYWEKLNDGGEESRCGWVKDRFDIWWQVVPEVLGKLMSDPSRSERVMQAFMQMKKFDIEKLENA